MPRRLLLWYHDIATAIALILDPGTVFHHRRLEPTALRRQMVCTPGPLPDYVRVGYTLIFVYMPVIKG